MKKTFLSLLLGVASLLSLTAEAQTKTAANTAPPWVSNKGYWVIESNQQTPKEAVVYFYNNENLLVYKKEIRNQRLNLKREKTLLELKTSLEDAITAFENGMASNQKKPQTSSW